MKPKPDWYCLHNLHGHLVGIHLLILVLNATRSVEFLMLLGKIFHLLGSKDLGVSES